MVAGGGGSTPSVAIPFTSYGAVTNSSTVQMSGSSQEATYTYNTGTAKVTSLSAASAFASGGTATFTLNSSGALTSEIDISALGTTISQIAANGDNMGTLLGSTGVIYSGTANGQNYILSFNRASISPTWDYQNFGVWVTGAGTGSGTVGAMTAGAATAGASVPTVGTFTFTGLTGGRYADAAGNGFFAASNMSATTNFATRSISFATTGSVTTPDFITITANNNLNMTGTLTYVAGSNQFTGAVTSAGGGVGNAAMTGTASGKFYGPAAQEIGGTFALTGGGVSGYLGGFGGKR